MDLGLRAALITACHLGAGVSVEVAAERLDQMVAEFGVPTTPAEVDAMVANIHWISGSVV